MKLKLAYSPCPNDTFAFHAMIHGLINTERLDFSVELADVDQLNKGAANGLYDICKLSYHAFFYICDKYAMLRTGSALGYNNGPLFVAPQGSRLFKQDGTPDRELISKAKVAIPGEKTTGALLLKIAYPEITDKEPVIFSSIEQEVMAGHFDAGVLIHEGRFTYRDKGLRLIEDLGTFWQTTSGVPIPLGGIAISRNFSPEDQNKVNRVLRRSIRFALDNPDISRKYVAENAQDMNEDIQKKHIKLFVNEFSIDIGEEGENAVNALYKRVMEIDSQICKRDNLFIL